MVEAVIYIPIVLFIVIALVELALFNMQEYIMMYESQRVASVVSREIAYPGYSSFGMGQNNEIDFDWGMGNLPSDIQIHNYYESYHSSASSLYREVSGILKAANLAKTDTGSYSGRFADAVTQSSLIAIGSVSEPEINVNDNLFGSSVTVTFTHDIPMPKALEYLGFEGATAIRTAAYNYAVNPSEFARNVDLASDLVDFAFDKLGISGGFNDFKAKVNNVLDKIL